MCPWKTTAEGNETVTLDEAETLCAAWLPRWTGNDPEALLACYAENTYYQDPAVPQGLTGHGALRPYFTKLLAANPDWVWEATEILPTDTGFVLKWTATIPTKEGPLRETGLDIVEVEAGKVVRNEVYFDPTRLRAARR